MLVVSVSTSLKLGEMLEVAVMTVTFWSPPLAPAGTVTVTTKVAVAPLVRVMVNGTLCVELKSPLVLVVIVKVSVLFPSLVRMWV